MKRKPILIFMALAVAFMFITGAIVVDKYVFKSSVFLNGPWYIDDTEVTSTADELNYLDGGVDGEQIQNDTVDDDALDFTDITGGDFTMTDVNAFGFATASYAFGTADDQDDLDVSGLSMIFLDSSSYAITIGGFDGGVGGQQLFLSVKDATETITIENDETSGEQEILLDGGGDVTLNVNEGIHLVCDGTNWWEINR